MCSSQKKKNILSPVVNNIRWSELRCFINLSIHVFVLIHASHFQLHAKHASHRQENGINKANKEREIKQSLPMCLIMFAGKAKTYASRLAYLLFVWIWGQKLIASHGPLILFLVAKIDEICDKFISIPNLEASCVCLDSLCYLSNKQTSKQRTW